MVLPLASPRKRRSALFLQVAIDFIDDPEVIELGDAITEDVGLPDWVGVHVASSCLQMLWRYLLKKSYREGILPASFTAKTVSRVCKYSGDAQRFFDALVAYNWVAVRSDGRFEVTGFLKWYGDFFDRRAQKAEAERARTAHLAAEAAKVRESLRKKAEQAARRRAEKKKVEVAKTQRGFAAQKAKIANVMQQNASAGLSPNQISAYAPQEASMGISPDRLQVATEGRQTGDVAATVADTNARIANVMQQDSHTSLSPRCHLQSKILIGAAAVPPAPSEAEIAAVEDELLGGPSASPPEEDQNKSSPAAHCVAATLSEMTHDLAAGTQAEAGEDGLDLSWMDQDMAASFRATVARAKEWAEEQARANAQIANLTSENAQDSLEAPPATSDSAFTKPQLAIVPKSRGNPEHRPSWSEMLGANMAYRPDYKALFEQVAPSWGEIDVALKAWVEKYPGGKRPNLKYITMCVESAREIARKPPPVVVPPGYRDELRCIGEDMELGDCPEHLAKRLVACEVSLQSVRSVAGRSSEWAKVVSVVTSRRGPLSVDRNRVSQLEPVGSAVVL